MPLSTPDQRIEDVSTLTTTGTDKDVRTTMSTPTAARAREDGADTADQAGGGGASKGGRHRVPALILVLVLVLGVAGYWTLVRSPAEDPAATSVEQQEGEAADAHEEDLDAGPVVALDPVSINLADGRYLKIALALQVEEGAEEEPDGTKALDLAIAAYSGRTLAELSDPTTRDASQAELTKQIEAAYEHEVTDVYYTEFVMQ